MYTVSLLQMTAQGYRSKHDQVWARPFEVPPPPPRRPFSTMFRDIHSSHQMWNSRCHPQRQPPFSQTSHLRLSTFRGGGGATPGATLAWQTRRDSSFATALFWWSKCPQCCSRGKLFLQSVLSRRPEEVVGAVGGIWEKRGEGMQKGPLECEHGPEVSRVSVQSCGTWLRASWGGALMSAESRPFWCGARRNEWALAGWQPARLWV